MPKELTHWVLAEKTFQRMDAGRLKTAIGKYYNIYHIGAVILDSPFYDLPGKAFDRAPDLGKKLHDKAGFDLFHHLGSMLAGHPQSTRESLWAFVAGILTHIHADAIFHPLIFYFSGNRDNPDRRIRRGADARHRKLEALLDLHFLDEPRLANRGLLSASLARLEINPRELWRHVNRLFYPDALCIGRVKTILTLHALIQGLFRRRGLQRGLEVLQGIPGIPLQSAAASFYPAYRKIDPPFFRNPIAYKHPVTGKPHRASIQDLEVGTITENLKLFIEMEGCRDDSMVREVLSARTEVSLETGLARSESKAMAHFDLSDPIENLVWQPMGPEAG